MAKHLEELGRVIGDFGIEIAASDDAMFVIGRLDALASVFARRYRIEPKIAGGGIEGVLKRAAQKEADGVSARLLRRASSRARILEQIAGTAEYGELRSPQIRRAERIRESLYELLDEWIRRSGQ